MKEYTVTNYIKDSNGDIIGERRFTIPQETVNEIRADERAKVLDEVLNEVSLEEKWLFTAIHEDKGNYEYNIDIAFSGIKNSLYKLKEQK